MIVLAGTTAQLCVSGDVYAEYEEVIRRPKFNRSEMIIDQTMATVSVTVRHKGKVTLTIRLTKKGRALLRAHGHSKLNLAGTFTPKGSRPVTIRETHTL